jgi:hypothetical protein
MPTVTAKTFPSAKAAFILGGRFGLNAFPAQDTCSSFEVTSNSLPFSHFMVPFNDCIFF